MAAGDLPLNIASGVATSFRTLIKLVGEAIDPSWEFEIRSLHGKPEGVFWRVGDPTLMRGRMGDYQLTDLQTGIRRVLSSLMESDNVQREQSE